MREPSTITDGVVALRLLIAALLSGLLGLERELKGQYAGFRTHILVSLGACLFAMTGAYAFQAVSGPSAVLRFDVTRVASQIVVGVGFLGGGVILHHGTTVRGLTTAANLWVAAAIGMATGMGFYFAGTVTSVIALAVLAGLKPFEDWLDRSRRPDRRHDEGAD